MAEALIPLDLSGDGLFRERMIDFRDVEQRVVRALTGGDDPIPALTSPCILVSAHLSPSETAALDLEFVRGFCLDEGGRTGHTAIIARSLGVPAVVGLRDASRLIEDGTSLAVDGAGGRVHLEPDEATLRSFEVRMRRRRRTEERLLKLRDVPAKTRDGRVVELSANIELPQEVDVALANGARGVGLVRTEYFYLSSSHLPSEDEQFASYCDLLRRVGRDTMIFRALDVGGDKLLAAMGGVREYNPFLGLRGARFLLNHPEILHTQLRAFYRASAHGRVKIMFPMVCDLEELRAFQREAAAVREVLLREGKPFDPDVELGIMVETPSAVLLAPELARECDFFSIGTNDLTQYLLAVDRTNAAVAHLARPEHPAVLRAIRDTVVAAHAAGIWVGCCGEMGSNPLFALLLVGLDIDEISTHAAAVPMVKKAIRSVSWSQARGWAADAVAMSTVEDVDRYLRTRATERLREFLGSEDQDNDEANGAERTRG
jgi:phosphoenolpyruvate-protein phosphotransferase